VEDGSDQSEDDHRISNGQDADSIHVDYLRDAFSNCAVDSSLALSIFNLISTSGELETLILKPTRKTTKYTPGYGDGTFKDLLRWLSREWICKRGRNGRVTAHEVGKSYTALCLESWQEEDSPYDPPDFFQQIFWDIWPRKTDEWWNDWKSLPLSSG